MANANDRQVGGNHYNHGDKPQHWDLVAIYDWDYFQGQITKYVMRWRDKGGIQDLEKAGHVLQKYIEVERAKEQAKLNAGRGESSIGIEPALNHQ
jgi:Protein of unknwon function (DUF3310)